MAITAVGYDGSVTEAQWAKLLRALGAGAGTQVVTSGFGVSVGVGTRALSVAAGEAYAAGVLVTSTAVEALTLAANTSGATRYDAVVLELNWATNTAVVKAITGSAVAPVLTQVAGTLWQIPLAVVAVPNGATTISGGNITTNKPSPRAAQKVTDTALTVGDVVSGSGTTLATIAVPDPGWPYILMATCRVRAQIMTAPASDGFAEVGVFANGSRFATGISSNLKSGEAPAVAAGPSNVLTGPSEVTVVGYRVSMGSDTWQIATGQAYSRVQLVQIPA